MKKMVLNPDMDERTEILEDIEALGGYCPCSLVRNEDTKCPCKQFREEGKCHCGLYVEADG